MDPVKNPFTHSYTRRVVWCGTLIVALILLLGYLAINGLIPVPGDYEHVVTWDNLLFASVLVLIVTSGLSVAVPAWLAMRQKQIEDERPH